MAALFDQIVGEVVPYEQDVEGDTIASVAWSVSPTGPTVTPLANTGTSATANFTSSVVGTFVLQCVLTLTTNGQIRKGRATISVDP